MGRLVFAVTQWEGTGKECMARFEFIKKSLAQLADRAGFQNECLSFVPCDGLNGFFPTALKSLSLSLSLFVSYYYLQATTCFQKARTLSIYLLVLFREIRLP